MAVAIICMEAQMRTTYHSQESAKGLSGRNDAQGKTTNIELHLGSLGAWEVRMECGKRDKKRFFSRQSI